MPRTVGVVLFPRFELLDVYGPMEMLGNLPDEFSIRMLGPEGDSVASTQGPRTALDHTYEDAPPVDILFVPGGAGTQAHADDRRLLEWLRERAKQAEIVASVCTGSASLAMAGVLDGYRATTNKRAFQWVSEQGPNVEWVKEARWVRDRNRWTCSGVAAGTDMSLALIASLAGEEVAQTLADRTEYEWHRDASWDPFAAKNGLV